MNLKDYLYYQDDWAIVYCGNCLEVMPLLKEKIDLILTDPPYGIHWNGKVKRGPHGTGKIGPTKNWDCKIEGDNKPFNPIPFIEYPNVILWGFHHYSSKLPEGSILVWLKRYDDGFQSFLSDADLAWKKNGNGVYCFRDLSLQGESKEKYHPTQKPIPLFQWCINFYPNVKTILDPFLGSGTTCIAAKNLNRKSIGIEISPEYCEIAVKRLRQEVFNFTK